MWVFYSLICALSLASADALTKKALSEGADERLTGWLRLVFAAPLMLMMVPFVEVPEYDRTFFVAIALGMPLEVLAFALYIKALRVSPMSLSLPFLSFTPVFLLAVSFPIVGELPSARGALGVLLIAAGGYVLNLGHFRRGPLEPFRAILREKGSVLMLAVAFIYSLTSSLGKLGIVHSSPLFYCIVYFLVLPVAYLPVALPSFSKTGWPKKHMAVIVFAGLLTGVSVTAHVTAVSLTNVSYMIAVKRTSMLFSVLYGCLLFREGQLRERTLGASLMLIGVAVLVASTA